MPAGRAGQGRQAGRQAGTHAGRHADGDSDVALLLNNAREACTYAELAGFQRIVGHQ